MRLLLHSHFINKKNSGIKTHDSRHFRSTHAEKIPSGMDRPRPGSWPKASGGTERVLAAGAIGVPGTRQMHPRHGTPFPESRTLAATGELARLSRCCLLPCPSGKTAPRPPSNPARNEHHPVHGSSSRSLSPLRQPASGAPRKPWTTRTINTASPGHAWPSCYKSSLRISASSSANLKVNRPASTPLMAR